MTKKRRPFFHVHDYIQFETDKSGIGPRWKLNIDTGGSGVYAKGIVTEVELNYIELDAIYPDGDVRTLRFPNYGSSDYETGQWFWRGYLSHADRKQPECVCGLGENSATHYMFCPVHDWLREKDREEEEKRRKEEEEIRKNSKFYKSRP